MRHEARHGQRSRRGHKNERNRTTMSQDSTASAHSSSQGDSNDTLSRNKSPVYFLPVQTRIKPKNDYDQNRRRDRKRRKNKVKPTYCTNECMVDSFAAYTSIHGMKNISQSSSHVMKIVWIFLIVASIVGLSVQVSELMKNYSNYPTATVVKNAYPKRLPQIVYCPFNWANVTRMQTLGMSIELYHYMESLLPSTYGYGWMPPYPINAEQIPELKIQLKDLVDKLAGGNFTDFVRRLSYTPDEMMDMSIAAFNDVDVQLLMTSAGPCIRVESSQDYSILTVNKAALVLRFKQHNLTFEGELETFYDRANMIIAGDTADNDYPIGEAFLTPEYHYHIKLDYLHIKNENIPPDGVCNASSTFKKTVMCILDCGGRLCRAMGMCDLYSPVRDLDSNDLWTNDVMRLCSAYDTTRNCMLQGMNIDEFRKGCFAECPPPCDITSYSISTTPFRQRKPAEPAEIYITLQDPMNRFYINEHTTYDISTMISNVGGAMGLWSGASVLSLVEIAYFFGCRPCIKSRRKEINFKY